MLLGLCAEEPYAFRWDDIRRTIIHVRHRWREPTGPVFEVEADDGLIYMLDYDETGERWQAHRVNRKRQNLTSWEDDQR
jgi:hypothetical protein